MPLELVKLTETELADKSKSLAQCVEEIAEVEAEKKDANAGFKARLETLSKTKAELARVVASGHEYRHVEAPLLRGIEKVTFSA